MHVMRDLLSALFRRVAKRMSDSEEIDGLWVAGSFGALELPKIKDALLFIKSNDPVRYARITKDLEGVWAALLPGPFAQFSYSDYICEIDERFVASASVEQIATVIVHEATHARLWRRGFRYEEDIRQRIEAICVRREQAFVSRLPQPEAAVEDFAVYLDLPSDYWSDKSFARWRTRGSVAALRYLNAPNWLIGMILRRHRAILRRERRAAARSRRALPTACESAMRRD